jgi:lysophospholipase L1-like esterase
MKVAVQRASVRSGGLRASMGHMQALTPFGARAPWLAMALAIATGCGSSSPAGGSNASPSTGTGQSTSTSPSSGSGQNSQSTGTGQSTSTSQSTASSGGGGTTGTSSSSSVAAESPDASEATPDATTLPDASLGAESGTGAPGDSDAEATGSADAGPAAVRFVGRVDYTNPASPRFAWSGSTILARFTGSSIGIKLSGPTTYFDVLIDGTLQAKSTLLTTGTTSYPLATNLAAGPHELEVYRLNEPGIGATGDTTYLGLILDPAGGTLLPPSAPAAHRIEIVGDSITTGFGDESVNAACPNQLAAQNYYVAYGAVAARTLNADLITIAWTGKGMYRNSGGDMTNTMPDLYGLTLPDQATTKWNFASWIPDAVVIYLGNNDFGQGDPGQPYVTTYNTFIARVRMNYPKALIVCTIGPNLMDPKLSEERTYVQGIVSTATAAGDMNVVFLEMPQPTAAEGTGCGGHPLAVTHARMGAALATLLQTKLGW